MRSEEASDGKLAVESGGKDTGRDYLDTLEVTNTGVDFRDTAGFLLSPKPDSKLYRFEATD